MKTTIHDQLRFTISELISIRGRIDTLINLVCNDDIAKNVYLSKLEIILFHCYEHFKISKQETISRHRYYPLAEARHIYCAIAKELFPKTLLKNIGELINRDRATVSNSIKNVSDAKFTGDKLYDDYEIIIDNVKNSFKEN